MPPEEFRRWAHEVADWIADYLAEVEGFPVLARVEPGALRRELPELPPELGEAPGPILEDFRRLILPGITHWNHPSFHAYFAVTGSGPGILGEMLSAALNINAMVWRSSPAATELEEHTTDWVRALLGLPEGFAGVIQDTASTSSLVALAAARHRAYPGARSDGLFGLPAGRIYASTEAHSSIEKAVMTLGMGQAGMARIPVGADFRMRPEALRQAVRQDRDRGFRPVAVVATLGTTSTTSVDPVGEIAEVARQEGLWLHVDAAYAGAAAMVPELRHHFEGWEQADSVVFNPHKWLFTPVDCSILFMRDPETVREAFSLVPEYLRTDEQGHTTDLMDFGVALGRRFRSLKLWFVLRYFGAAGLRDRIRAHVAMARELAGWIDEAQGWLRVAPAPFSTVVFRLAPEGMDGEEADALNLAVLDEVNRQGEAFLSHTRLDGRVCIRLAIGNLRTTREHVERAWTLVRAAGDRCLAAGDPGR
jgi:aromatic-L-amino-acid/L-tryptophan decarboxylase